MNFTIKKFQKKKKTQKNKNHGWNPKWALQIRNPGLQAPAAHQWWGAGWVSHLEPQLLGLFQKLQSTANPQRYRVKPQHWLTGSVPHWALSPLGQQLCPAPSILSTGSHNEDVVEPSGQHPACWQLLPGGHCCASQGRATASLAELIVSCHVTGNSQSYCTKLLKQPTKCIHIQSGRVIFRHQHSWEQQSQRQRRNYQLKQEIWACKPLCLCESYPVPEGNRDMWRRLEKVCSPAVHPEKPPGREWDCRAWLPMSVTSLAPSFRGPSKVAW